MLGDILFFEKQMSKSVIEQILEGIRAGKKLYESMQVSAVTEIPADMQSVSSELCRGDNLKYMELS